MSTRGGEDEEFGDSERISYEWVRSVLSNQLDAAQALDAKIVNMWVLATAVVGIGIPIAVGSSQEFSTDSLDWRIYAAFASYLIVTVAAFVIYLPKREINLVNRPDLLRWHLWNVPQRRFYREMLIHIENAWRGNARVLFVKAWGIRLAMVFTTTELLFSLWWLWLRPGDVVR